MRNGSFGLLWSGQLLSATGTWLLIVAVPVQVFQLTHSARDTGLAFVAEVIPMVFGPVAGVFADRWSKRQTMIITNLLRAASVLLLVFFTSAGRLWVLLLSVAAENGLGTFFTPAYRGVVPLIVGRGPDLESANAWSTGARGITQLAGAPLGGALYVALGFRWVVGLDTISYLISVSCCIAALPAPGRKAKDRSGAPSKAEQRNRALGAFLRDLETGITRLCESPVLSAMSGITALFMIGNGALTAVLVPYVSARLHGSATTVGVLLSGLGAGYLLSAYPGKRLCASPRLRGTLLGLLAGIVATFAVFFNTRSPAIALLALSLAGLPGGAFLMLEQTLVQRIAADDVIGRISAAYSAIENGATLAGALLASIIVRRIGLTTTTNTAIVIITAGCLLVPLIPKTASAAAATEAVTSNAASP